jgi:predicted kinase
MLIVFGGLPGVGKSTLARAVAQARRATYLRIDTIEQVLRESGELAAGEIGPSGYLVAYALAEANLQLGGTVVADSTNPLAITRQAWRDVAARAGTAAVEIEVICSDAEEHRRRVETRTVDIAGLRLPSWESVLARHYDPWDRERIVLDTAQDQMSVSLAKLLELLPNQNL